LNRPLAGPAAWFIRRNGEVSGPFPHGLLVRYRELGRLKPPDEVSADGVNWFRLEEVPALAEISIVDDGATGESEVAGEVDWARERGRARRRWLEERWIPDRRTGEGSEAGARRARGPDRRSDPNARESVHFGSDGAAPASRWATVAIALAVLMAVGLAALAVWKLAPSKTLQVVLFKPAAPDCSALPAPGVRWTGCDKRGAALEGTDLTGTDLENANLAGADLSQSRLDGANLSNTDLRGADLDGASLDGADLSGARLDDATWLDGSRCGRASIGHCETKSP
jgi:hypothetical protein